MTAERRLLFRRLLVFLMSFTLLFIFGNSALSRSNSSTFSQNVLKSVLNVIGSEGFLASFLTQYIRKIAHFTEFGLLGAEAYLYFRLSCYQVTERKTRLLFLCPVLLFGLISAAVDESIQLLNDRGSSLADVWLDFSGFCFFILLTCGFLFLFRICRHPSGRRKNPAEK